MDVGDGQLHELLQKAPMDLMAEARLREIALKIVRNRLQEMFGPEPRDEVLKRISAEIVQASVAHYATNGHCRSDEALRALFEAVLLESQLRQARAEGEEGANSLRGLLKRKISDRMREVEGRWPAQLRTETHLSRLVESELQWLLRGADAPQNGDLLAIEAMLDNRLAWIGSGTAFEAAYRIQLFVDKPDKKKKPRDVKKPMPDPTPWEVLRLEAHVGELAAQFDAANVDTTELRTAKIRAILESFGRWKPSACRFSDIAVDAHIQKGLKRCRTWGRIVRRAVDERVRSHAAHWPRESLSEANIARLADSELQWLLEGPDAPKEGDLVTIRGKILERLVWIGSGGLFEMCYRAKLFPDDWARSWLFERLRQLVAPEEDPSREAAERKARRGQKSRQSEPLREFSQRTNETASNVFLRLMKHWSPEKSRADNAAVATYIFQCIHDGASDAVSFGRRESKKLRVLQAELSGLEATFLRSMRAAEREERASRQSAAHYEAGHLRAGAEAEKKMARDTNPGPSPQAEPAAPPVDSGSSEREIDVEGLARFSRKITGAEISEFTQKQLRTAYNSLGVARYVVARCVLGLPELDFRAATLLFGGDSRSRREQQNLFHDCPEAIDMYFPLPSRPGKEVQKLKIRGKKRRTPRALSKKQAARPPGLSATDVALQLGKPNCWVTVFKERYYQTVREALKNAEELQELRHDDEEVSP